METHPASKRSVFPAFARRGGCAHQGFPKCAQTGWLRNIAKHPYRCRAAHRLKPFNKERFAVTCGGFAILPTTPSAPLKEADHFLDGAATPPCEGGEYASFRACPTFRRRQSASRRLETAPATRL